MILLLLDQVCITIDFLVVVPVWPCSNSEKLTKPNWKKHSHKRYFLSYAVSADCGDEAVRPQHKGKVRRCGQVQTRIAHFQQKWRSATRVVTPFLHCGVSRTPLHLFSFLSWGPFFFLSFVRGSARLWGCACVIAGKRGMLFGPLSCLCWQHGPHEHLIGVT